MGAHTGPHSIAIFPMDRIKDVDVDAGEEL